VRTLQEILEIIDSIPERMCGHPQPLYLYELSKRTQGSGSIVEIGTCAGKSIIALAYAQQEKNGVKSNTIDIFEHPEVERNLKKAGVANYANRMLGRSSVLAANWHEPIELLWIDGDHRYNGVVADIKGWSRYVITGGVMAFHDYPGHRRTGEVGRAVYKYVLSRPEEWRVISDRKAGSIVAFERLRKTSRSVRLINRIRRKRANLRWYYEELLSRLKRRTTC